MSKSKPWNRSRKGHGSERARQRRRVLIYCEDSKSSADYLRSFPIDPRRVEICVVGTGRNTDGLVEAVITARDKALKLKTPYSQVWCVFDRDSFPLENYSRAFELAHSNKIRIAWANEAFELWYLLHSTTSMRRSVESTTPRNSWSEVSNTIKQTGESTERSGRTRRPRSGMPYGSKGTGKRAEQSFQSGRIRRQACTRWSSF